MDFKTPKEPKSYADPRDKRLAREYFLLEELCKKTSKISFKPAELTKSSGLPYKYRIFYKVQTIVGIDANNKPIISSGPHEAEITLPPGYPAASDPPIPSMISDAWHPNIKSKNPGKGHICVNMKFISAAEGIDGLVLRIGELLQYKNYFAEDRPPYPEDPEVAKWIREIAEPQKFVAPDKPIDNSNLMDGVAVLPPVENKPEDDSPFTIINQS